jgi:hypothetical protein
VTIRLYRTALATSSCLCSISSRLNRLCWTGCKTLTVIPRSSNQSTNATESVPVPNPLKICQCFSDARKSSRNRPPTMALSSRAMSFMSSHSDIIWATGVELSLASKRAMRFEQYCPLHIPPLSLVVIILIILVRFCD